MSGAALTGSALLTRGAWASELFPVVETSNGKIQGASSAGVHVFKGVRYGASTEGRNRFMPPQPVEKWAGVRSALAFGDVSPQATGNRVNDYADLIVFDRQPAGPGEDCLSLNLWTTSLDQQAKKPVIVVLHGGGFYAGSGNSFGLDGEKMARFADSVVIAVNHRLGAFGFAHLAELGGERFATSGTVGMQDIVAALEWVRENVSQFGGDPSRVLVYGQSGGGAKTSTLLAMPSAKGLFHRAGVMSGSLLRAGSPERASETAERLLAALELTPSQIDRLQDVPFTTILEAQAKLEAADRARGEAPGSFGPVVDGTVIPRHPWHPGAPPEAADVPMIISTVLDERSYRMVNFDLDEAGLLDFIRTRAGDKADETLRMYRAEDPDATPFVLQARIDTDLGFRRAAFAQAEMKARAGGAPVWTYLWTWPAAAFDGRYGAVHGVDVGLSLHSVRGGLTGAQADSLLMADRISSAWAAFAASGDPNNARLPQWDAYDTNSRATMIFDNDTRQEMDPRREFREFWNTVPATGATF
ncbi:MAG: carboxylesterase/lipase family protein [Hyphomonas sp.]